MNTKNELKKFMKSCSYLGSYMNNPKEPDNSPVEIAVEYVLSDCSWDEMQTLIKIIGVRQMAQIFRANIEKWKPYFRPITVHYLKLYFNYHAFNYRAFNYRAPLSK